MSFKIKLEFIKILIHHVIGIKQVNKSPHFPCGLNVDAIRGLNFNVLYLNTRATSR